MINLFDIASNDQSIYYLGNIFGMVSSLLPVQQPTLLLGIMFKVLNTTALTIGAFLVIYVTIVGLLKTAQEGEFLGRNWNSLWVPVRTVLGIASLFPTASGYSAIQVIFMWIIVQGIGAADTLWSTVLGYASAVGSPYSAVTVPTTSVSNTLQTLFQSMVCQASAKADNLSNVTMTSIPGTVRYYCVDNPSDPFCKQSPQTMLTVRDDSSQYSMGPTGQCGVLHYCNSSADKTVGGKCADPSSTDCAACKAQHAALQAIVPLFGQIAADLVLYDNQFLQFYEQGQPSSWISDYCTATGIAPDECCVVTAPQPQSEVASASSNPAVCSFNLSDIGPNNDLTNVNVDTIKKLYLAYPITSSLGKSNLDFTTVAMNQYVTNLVGAITTALSTQIAAQQTTGELWIDEGKKSGWITAGGFYYFLAKQNQKGLDAANQPFSIDATDPATDTNSLMHGYRNNFSAAGLLLNAIQQESMPAPSYSAPVQFNSMTSVMHNVQGTLLHTFIANLSGNTNVSADNAAQAGFSTNSTKTNPLVSIATFGYSLMITAQLLFVVIVATVFTVTAVFTVDPMLVGTGFTMNTIGEGVKAVWGIVGPFIVIMIAGLYALGAILGIYIPLIPFIVFTVGAIGWFLSVIEAMVAAPIVALGILSPGGQHDILGRAGPTMMFLLNLFLRPSLMIFGLIFAMLLSVAVINLINAGYLMAVGQIMTAPGLFEEVLFISTYVSLLVTALNKVFSLIYVLPERITTWVEGPAVSHGEGEALGASKQAIEGSASTTSGASKESGAHGEHAGTTYVWAKKKSQAQTAKVAPAGGGEGKSESST